MGECEKRRRKEDPRRDRRFRKRGRRRGCCRGNENRRRRATNQEATIRLNFSLSKRDNGLSEWAENCACQQSPLQWTPLHCNADIDQRDCVKNGAWGIQEMKNRKTLEWERIRTPLVSPPRARIEWKIGIIETLLSLVEKIANFR